MFVKIGLFGGTFDPVHYGHLLLAERCREALDLDQVRFIPAADPPHKDRDDLTDGVIRAEMLEFATAGNPHLVVDRRELHRSGPSFTVDTLAGWKAEQPEDDLYFLMGADSLVDLPTWRQPERIVELATIVAVNRGDEPLPDPASLVALLGEKIAAKVRFVTIPGMTLSATELRERARVGRSLRYTMPAAVIAYIEDKRLYRAGDS